MKKIAGITLTALAIMASACHSDKTQNEGDGAYTHPTHCAWPWQTRILC